MATGGATVLVPAGRSSIARTSKPAGAEHPTAAESADELRPDQLDDGHDASAGGRRDRAARPTRRKRPCGPRGPPVPRRPRSASLTRRPGLLGSGGHARGGWSAARSPPSSRPPASSTHTYGTLTDGQYVAPSFYRNVLACPGDAGGIAYWSTQLERLTSSTRGQVRSPTSRPRSSTGRAPTPLRRRRATPDRPARSIASPGDVTKGCRPHQRRRRPLTLVAALPGRPCSVRALSGRMARSVRTYAPTAGMRGSRTRAKAPLPRRGEPVRPGRRTRGRCRTAALGPPRAGPVPPLVVAHRVGPPAGGSTRVGWSGRSPASSPTAFRFLPGRPRSGYSGCMPPSGCTRSCMFEHAGLDEVGQVEHPDLARPAARPAGHAVGLGEVEVRQPPSDRDPGGRHVHLQSRFGRRGSAARTGALILRPDGVRS